MSPRGRIGGSVIRSGALAFACVLSFLTGCSSVEWMPEPKRPIPKRPRIQARSYDDGMLLAEYKRALHTDLQAVIQDALSQCPDARGYYIRLGFQVGMDGGFRNLHVLDAAGPQALGGAVFRNIQSLSPYEPIPEEIHYLFPNGSDPITFELGDRKLRKK
jgi:hypothetical protein